MPNFFEGLLLVIMIFGFCLGLAIIIRIGTLWVEQKYSKPSNPHEVEPKIYLIKQTANSKPKQRKKRSPKIAFEGLALKPENVLISENYQLNEEPQNKKRASF